MAQNEIKTTTVGYMTNKQYREELNKMFESIDENLELRWFYIFVKEKLRLSNKKEGL